MKISEVEIVVVKPQGGLIAFASLVLDENIYLSNIAIHKKLNDDSYRLTYPTKGIFTVFHPINKAASLEIELAIISKLKDVMKRTKGNV
jgi:DNA-binding cell septation regulator SpoVG